MSAGVYVVIHVEFNECLQNICVFYVEGSLSCEDRVSK